MIVLLLGRVGSEDSVRAAESFGYDRRQGQSAIETLAVKLTKPFVGLLSVPNEYNRLNGIVAPCTSPGVPLWDGRMGLQFGNPVLRFLGIGWSFLRNLPGPSAQQNYTWSFATSSFSREYAAALLLEHGTARPPHSPQAVPAPLGRRRPARPPSLVQAKAVFRGCQ